MERTLRICLVMGLFLLNGSCSRDAETSSLSIQLPKSGQIFQSVTAQSNDGFNSSLDPASLADINCYGVFVGGTTPDVSGNFCKDSSNGVEKFRFGPSTIFHPAGSLISIDVPSGPDREIIIAGTKAQNGACAVFPPNSGGNPDTSNMGTPHIIARKIVDLQPGDQTEQVTTAFNSAEKFDDCSFFSGGGGGPQRPMFGDGRDGDITVGSGTITMSSTTYGALSSYTPSAASVASTKKISSHRRVTAISGDGLTISTEATFGVEDFDVGDEVLLHITAASDSANFANADTHCGTNHFIGMFDFATVVSTPDTSTIVVDNPLNGSTGFNNAGIGHSVAQTDQNFCRIQIVRVPNFNSITISGGAATFTQDAFAMSGTSGSGGLIAFRAKQLDLTSSGFTVEASGLGFQGQAQAAGETGESIHGQPASQHLNSPIANAGQGSFQGSGGGGGAGAGGQGNQQAGLGGQAIDFCSGACLPMRDRKIFFGGAGGSGSTDPGSDGGGAAVIHVGTITGSNPFTINADGSQSGTQDSAGGGGGAVHLTYQSAAQAFVTVNARGGNSQAQQQTTGAGGGGSVEIARCAAQTQQQPQANAATGTGGTPGIAGEVSNLNETAICNEPI